MFVLCLVLATFKDQVDQLNLVELANQFCIGNEHYFYIFGKFKIRDFPYRKCSCGDPSIIQRYRLAETQTC